MGTTVFAQTKSCNVSRFGLFGHSFASKHANDCMHCMCLCTVSTHHHCRGTQHFRFDACDLCWQAWERLDQRFVPCLSPWTVVDIVA